MASHLVAAGHGYLCSSDYRDVIETLKGWGIVGPASRCSDAAGIASVLHGQPIEPVRELCLLVAACASAPNPSGVNAAVGARLADMPHWMGGLPPDAPPRPGTPEYEAWQAERAKEAARPKSGTTSQPAR